MDSISKYFKANIAIDYANYQKFCVENALQVRAYSDFLAASAPNTTNLITSSDAVKQQHGCGSCGGGKAR